MNKINTIAKDTIKNKKSKPKLALDRIQNCIEEQLSYDEEIMLADGFEDAFIGIARKYGLPPFAVYDRTKCIKMLIEQEMTEEEAEEFFEFNIAGAYLGENTPAFINLCEQ